MTQKRYLKTLLRFLKLGIYNQQTFYNVLYIFTYKRDSSLQQLNAFNFQDEEFEPLAIFFVVLVFYSLYSTQSKSDFHVYHFSLLRRSIIKQSTVEPYRVCGQFSH